MRPRLVQSALFAAGVHALLFLPAGMFPGLSGPAQVDLMRGSSSVELELVGQAEPGAGTRAYPEGQEELPPTGRQPESWEQDPGAVLRLDPGLLRNPAPVYPRIARLQGWQGTVVLHARVGGAGGVERLEVHRTSGYVVLDEAALAAVRGWRFKPASRSGRPVGSSVEIPVTFKLNAKE